MDTLKRLFLEDPTTVYVLFALIELVAIVVWYRQRSRRSLIALAVPVVLGGAVFALDSLVVTDREELQKAVRQIADAFEQRRVDTVLDYLDDEYSGFAGNKAQAVDRARSELRLERIESIRLSYNQLTVRERFAEMTVTSVIKTTSSAGGRAVALQWKVEWVKRSAGWRIIHISPPTPVIPGFTG
jgi:hypothetical protein